MGFYLAAERRKKNWDPLWSAAALKLFAFIVTDGNDGWCCGFCLFEVSVWIRCQACLEEKDGVVVLYACGRVRS
jgi:hypothetical protein